MDLLACVLWIKVNYRLGTVNSKSFVGRITKRSRLGALLIKMSKDVTGLISEIEDHFANCINKVLILESFIITVEHTNPNHNVIAPQSE